VPQVAGNPVRGKVVLTVLRPVRATGYSVILAMDGKEKVRWLLSLRLFFELWVSSAFPSIR